MLTNYKGGLSSPTVAEMATSVPFMIIGSLSNGIFERRTPTTFGLLDFFILGQCFYQNFWTNCLYKSKETQQNKFGSVETH